MPTSDRNDDDPPLEAGDRNALDDGTFDRAPENDGPTDVDDTADDFGDGTGAYSEMDGDEVGEDDAEEAPVYTTSRLRAEIDAAKAEGQDRYLRLVAEYDNFRKRTDRERSQLAADALGDFVRDLLPVFDSLDKACALAADDRTGVAEGLALIRRQLETVLPKHGIAVQEPRGAAFDPRLHEALTQQPTKDHAPGTVLEVFEKGYVIDGRLLRPARVVVAAKAP